MDTPESTESIRDHNVALATDDSERLQAVQREVQRKLGRNLLRLQQYERLIKAMVAEQDIAGPIGELQNIKERQIQAVAKKTLGQVVGELTGAYIAPALPEETSQQDEEHPCTPNQPWVRITSRIEMKEEDFKETERKLAELVNLRNELVHHFLENYEIWTEAGCLIADSYLDGCYKQIDAHYEELRGWAKHNLEAREHLAGIAKTPEFLDFFIHGIMPGGAGVCWTGCTIVNLLRDAEEALASDGWTFLQEAVNYIQQHEPEHTPARYGCSSWRHVLHESEQFEVRREQQAPGLPTATWYRSRPI
jgi:hypothetical protein